MKPGAILLALVLAAAPLAAQTSTPPIRLAQSAEGVTSHPSAATPAELARRGETPEQIHDATGHWPCEEFAPGDIITPHITDSHCLEVPSFPKFWEPHEVVLPRWKPIFVQTWKRGCWARFALPRCGNSGNPLTLNGPLLPACIWNITQDV